MAQTAIVMVLVIPHATKGDGKTSARGLLIAKALNVTVSELFEEIPDKD